MIKVVQLSEIRPGLTWRERVIFVSGIRQHWCPFAAGRGQCNQNCFENDFCHPVISRATLLADAQKPIALLIHNLQVEKERIRQAGEEPQIEVNIYGQVGSGKTFSELMMSLDPLEA